MSDLVPNGFVTLTQMVLAQKGKGKSYLVSTQVEHLLDLGMQVVAIDPTGAWWGLRSSPDGRSTGYSIAVIGGDHGDIPLEATAGELLADAIATEHFSCVIDISHLRKGEALRFMAIFLETLYRKNKSALHLVLDEADVVAPQKPFGPEQARVLGAAEDIVRRGRIKGIGCTMITQRPQVINKDVLSQADMLTTLGMSHPKDLGAIEAWVSVHGDPERAKEMIASLPALPVGEAWVWAPGLKPPLFKRVKVPRRVTFDSGRTPKHGERATTAKVLAPVDIRRLGAAIAATAERVKADDPKALRARVAELERELAKKPAATPSKVSKASERPLMTEPQINRVAKLITQHENAGAALHANLMAVVTQVRRELDRADSQIRKHEELAVEMRRELRLLIDAAQPEVSLKDAPEHMRRAWWRNGAAPVPHAHDKGMGAKALITKQRVEPATDGTEPLAKVERAMLIALAQHPGGLTRKQILIFAGYRHSGTTTNGFARLLRDQYVESTSGRLTITDRGKDVLGHYEPLPTGDALRASLLNGSDLAPAEQAILSNACSAFPQPVTREAARGEYAHSGTTTNAFAKLIAMGYLTKVRGGVRAAEELFS